jgi:phosphoenolpyruvate carboxykinase (ATP)
VTECPEVPSEILIPRNTWADKSAYDATAQKLVNLFKQNFSQYEAGAGQTLKEAAPRG